LDLIVPGGSWSCLVSRKPPWWFALQTPHVEIIFLVKRFSFPVVSKHESFAINHTGLGSGVLLRDVTFHASQHYLTAVQRRIQRRTIRRMTMNKKTLAIAALALFATSGLASARTIHSPKAETVHSQTTAATSPYDAMNQSAVGAQNQEINRNPGDNDMDLYHTQDAD
jgi:hypothetical protein